MNIMKTFNMNKITKKAKRVYHAGRLFCKTHSSDIALVVGSIGVLMGTGMACVATKRQDEIIEDSHDRINDIHESEVLSEEEEVREIAKAHGALIVNTARNYAPAAFVYSLSMASIFWAHHKQKCQYLALASAYETLSQSYKQYRKRVRDELGEDQDHHFLTGQRMITSASDEPLPSEVAVDSEGNLVNTPRYPILDEKNLSAYARVFDESNPCFNKDFFERNTMYVGQAECYFTDILCTRKYLWLNEVYRYLGFEETLAGTQVGWVYDDTECSTSDNRVCFDAQVVLMPDEITGELKKVILLDFNVDGPIATRAKMAKI